MYRRTGGHDRAMAETLENITRGQVVSAAGALGSRAVSEYLDRHGWHFELFAHKPTFRAGAEAIASGANRPSWPRREAPICARRESCCATRPRASRPRTRSPAAFPLVDVGAVPPLGEMLKVPQLLDVRLLQYSRIVASAGDHPTRWS